jgi:hypothetical protein
VKTEIEIRDNNYSFNQFCAVCSVPTDVGVGPAVFLKGVDRAVCQTCAEQHSPGMQAELERKRAEFLDMTPEEYAQHKKIIPLFEEIPF